MKVLDFLGRADAPPDQAFPGPGRGSPVSRAGPESLRDALDFLRRGARAARAAGELNDAAANRLAIVRRC